MEDIGWSKTLRRLDYGAAEEHKALRIIGIVAFSIAVKAVASAEFGVFDEVKLHSIVLTAVDNLAEEQIILHWNAEIGDCKAVLLRARVFIARQKDRNFVPQRAQSFGKRADNVGKTAGFRVRHTFRCGERDSHPDFPRVALAVRPSTFKRRLQRRSENLQILLLTEENLKVKAKVRV